MDLKFLDWFKPSLLLRRLGLVALEKYAGRYYEGPKPPARLQERVKSFRLQYPDATPEEWALFALRFGSNCYQEGFRRGFEWERRSWKPEGRKTPEQRAEEQQEATELMVGSPEWRLMLELGEDPRNPLYGYTFEQRRSIIQLMEQAALGRGSYGLQLGAYTGPAVDGISRFHGQGESSGESE